MKLLAILITLLPFAAFAHPPEACAQPNASKVQEQRRYEKQRDRERIRMEEESQRRLQREQREYERLHPKKK